MPIVAEALELFELQDLVCETMGEMRPDRIPLIERVIELREMGFGLPVQFCGLKIFHSEIARIRRHCSQMVAGAA